MLISQHFRPHEPRATERRLRHHDAQAAAARAAMLTKCHASHADAAERIAAGDEILVADTAFRRARYCQLLYLKRRRAAARAKKRQKCLQPLTTPHWPRRPRRARLSRKAPFSLIRRRRLLARLYKHDMMMPILGVFAIITALRHAAFEGYIYLPGHQTDAGRRYILLAASLALALLY